VASHKFADIGVLIFGFCNRAYGVQSPQARELLKLVNSQMSQHAINVALLYDILWPMGVPFVWGPCSAEHDK